MRDTQPNCFHLLIEPPHSQRHDKTFLPISLDSSFPFHVQHSFHQSIMIGFLYTFSTYTSFLPLWFSLDCSLWLLNGTNYCLFHVMPVLYVQIMYIPLAHLFTPTHLYFTVSTLNLKPDLLISTPTAVPSIQYTPSKHLVEWINK